LRNTWDTRPVRGWIDTSEASPFAADLQPLTRLGEDAGVPLKPSVSSDGSFVVFPLVQQELDPKGKRLVVAQGQTLETIAASNKTTVSELVRSNGLPKPYVKPGQAIFIPTHNYTSTLWR